MPNQTMATAENVHVVDTIKPSSWGPIYRITADKAQRVLDAALANRDRVVRVYGYNTTPDHNNRQCVDFMHYGDTKLRVWLENYLKANKAHLGVEGIISNHHVMGFPSQGTWYLGPEGVWRVYSGPNPHTDHVHAQFNLDAVQGNPHDPADKILTFWCIKPVDAYDGSGNRRKEFDLKRGDKITGTVNVKQFPGDGRYVQRWDKPHAIYYPLDSGNFSHAQNGAPIGK